ncbi:MAG: hypothetical protein JRJ65_12880 [Deltaproteobacteria bacterium]|nr:hypothetical protein [Deltaproteobacteria bacterium]
MTNRTKIMKESIIEIEKDQVFRTAGHDSPIMYFHRSPDLLRIKTTSVKGHS